MSGRRPLMWLITFGFLLFAGRSAAQSECDRCCELQTDPGWSFSPSMFSDSMSVTAIVTIDKIDQTSGTLGAFVGTEVRGLQASSSLVSFGAHAGKYLYLLSVYADTSGETLTFQFYQENTITLVQTLTFQVNGRVGDVLLPTALTGTTPSSCSDAFRGGPGKCCGQVRLPHHQCPNPSSAQVLRFHSCMVRLIAVPRFLSARVPSVWSAQTRLCKPLSAVWPSYPAQNCICVLVGATLGTPHRDVLSQKARRHPHHHLRSRSLQVASHGCSAHSGMCRRTSL